MIELDIKIDPVGQLRPRATRYGNSIRLYDPPKVAEFKKNVAEIAKIMLRQKGEKKFENQAIKVKLIVYRKVQDSISKKERCRRLSHVHRPTVKYDLDNYIKSILDALNGVLWDDDRNIVSIEAEKFYSETPHFKIKVSSLEQKS